MQIHPLVPMKKAASLLGVDKRILKQRLVEGAIKGERRRVGNKEKWFIYSGEIECLIDAERLPELAQMFAEPGAMFAEPGAVLSEPEQILVEPEERVSVEDLSTFFEETLVEGESLRDENRSLPADTTYGNHAEELVAETISFDPTVHDAVDEGVSRTHKSVPATMSVPVEYFLEAVTREFAVRLSIEHQATLDAEQKLKEKDERLAVIPRLESELKTSQKTIAEKNSVIQELKERLNQVEKDLCKKNRPWWQRWFGTAPN